MRAPFGWVICAHIGSAARDTPIDGAMAPNLLECWASRLAQGRAVYPSPKPSSSTGMPMPSSGVWKTMKVATSPSRKVCQERLLEDHFGIAAIVETPHEIGAADVLPVDV